MHLLRVKQVPKLGAGVLAVTLMAAAQHEWRGNVSRMQGSMGRSRPCKCWVYSPRAECVRTTAAM
jgi:hypothetical protein